MDITEAIIADVDHKVTVDSVTEPRQGVTVHLTADLADTIRNILHSYADFTLTNLDEARQAVTPRAFDGNWDAELTEDSEVAVFMSAVMARYAREACRFWETQVMDVAFPADDEDDDE